MANATRANKIYVDSTGLITTDQVKICHIIMTPNGTTDAVTLRESSSGPDVLTIKTSSTKETKHLRFEGTPLLFNGLYISSISSGAVVTIVVTNKGAG